MKLAITGKMRSGKDTLGEFLTEMYDFEEFKFSKGISEVIQQYFPEASGKRKMRNFYQTIGQSMRSLDQDVWIKYIQKDIDKYLAANGEFSDIVITDLRQKNEYKHLKDSGFIIIKIEADEDIRISRAIKANDTFDMASLRHETELSVDLIPADITISNNGSLDEFHSTLNKTLLALFLSCTFVESGLKVDFEEAVTMLSEVKNVTIEY